MGSKKKKSGNRKKSSHSNNNNAVRSAQPDMSKYAGAVSNKSKRNYSDLKLVRPGNLTEYASRGSRRSEVSDASGALKSERSEKPRTPKRKTQSSASVKKTHIDEKSGSTKRRSAAKSSVGKPKKKRPPSSKPAEPKVEKAEYTQDEYSKALNNSDFYSSVVEKYYLKHPEESEKRDKSSVSRKKKRRPPDAPVKSSPSSKKPASSGKSVAEMAVKGRGSAAKKNHARIMKNGRAKGVVPSRAAHRRVRQRNRRRTVFFNSIIVMTTVVFLMAVYVTVFFNVKKIEVQGESPYSAQKIIEMCNFNKGDNILFVDADGSETKIVEQLPYIESCEIKRKLPATVVVNVTEAQALGVAEVSGNLWAVVSTKGKILEMVTNATVVSSSDIITSLVYDPDAVSVIDIADKKGLPVLEGIDINEDKTGGYISGDAAQHLDEFEKIHTKAASLGLKLTRLRYSDRGYEIEYDGRINIVLGNITDEKTISNHLEKANYILRVSGDITDHEHGEITYLKNETFYNPSYEQEDSE